MSLEGRISDTVGPELGRRGHKVETRAPWSMNASGGIMVEEATGTVSAGADPRTQGVALAW